MTDDKPLPAFAVVALTPFEWSSEDPVERVLELWHRNDGWIPGADYDRLAEALKVPVDRTIVARRRGRIAQ